MCVSVTEHGCGCACGCACECMMVRMLCGCVCEHVCVTVHVHVSVSECGAHALRVGEKHRAKPWVPKSAFSSLVLGR